MVDEDSYEGEGHDTVTLGTGPAPAPPVCLAAAQDFNREVLIHTSFSVAPGDCDPEPRGSRAMCSRQRQSPRGGWETEANKPDGEENKKCQERKRMQGRVEQEEVSAERSALAGCSESQYGSRLEVWPSWKGLR